VATNDEVQDKIFSNNVGKLLQEKQIFKYQHYLCHRSYIFK